MNCFVSSPCEPPHEELDTRHHEPCFSACDGCLEVLCEPAVAAEPREGAFHNPSAGQNLEAFSDIGAFDDLERPLAELGQSIFEFGSGVAAIGEDMAQPGKGRADRSQQWHRAVAVLDLGAVNHGGDEEPTGVGEDVALAPLDQLARIEPTRTAA